MAINKEPIQSDVAIVTEDRRGTPYFLRWLRERLDTIEGVGETGEQLAEVVSAINQRIGSLRLVDLADYDNSVLPSAAQVVSWDDAAGKWKPAAQSGGGGGGGGEPSWGGNGAQNYRNHLITVTGVGFAGSPQALVNGSIDNACYFIAGAGAASITFDFKAGFSARITGFLWLQQNNANHGTWRIRGSHDAATWTDIHSGFYLDGTAPVEFTNPTSYRYYHLEKIAGSTSSGPYLHEILFRIAGLTA